MLMRSFGRAGRALPGVRGRGRLAITLTSPLLKAGAEPNGPQFSRAIVQLEILDHIWEGKHRLDAANVDIEGHEAKFLQGGHNTINSHRPVIFGRKWRDPASMTSPLGQNGDVEIQQAGWRASTIARRRSWLTSSPGQ
jgi:hypothetical protein